jgi:hypothetical protein
MFRFGTVKKGNWLLLQKRLGKEFQKIDVYFINSNSQNVPFQILVHEPSQKKMAVSLKNS